MTQNGVVTKLLDKNRAEVAVERGTACGGHCDGCETCVYAARLVIAAENVVCAQPGDRVVLESGTRGIMGAAFLVYMLPLALFFAGYAAAAAFGMGQGLCILASLGGVVIGGALAVFFGRRKTEIVFRITGYQR